MKIAVASDEQTHLTDHVVAAVKRRGHEVRLFGPLTGGDEEWAAVSAQLAEDVAGGRSDQGVLFCWTGTGSCIAANKVQGIRAALCSDADTAKGARKWNHANVLVMSLRLISEAQADEILDAWFSTPYGEEDFDVRNVTKVGELEQRYAPPGDTPRA
jgi:ribose 5-phosphate isomerase B